ncbi:MAG TPA: head GIN domain-containing protein [Chitinophagaceae bacterium]|jgi:hypothetical protein
MRQIILLGVASMVLLSSCRQIFAKRIRGTGNVTTQTRTVGQFNSVDVSGSIDVYVKQDSTTGVRVEADDNLQQYITVLVDGDVLRIKTEEGYNINSSRKIKVYVSGTGFKRFEASGACNYYSDGRISTPSNVDLDLSGSCDATMEFDAPQISAGVSGACSVTLKGKTKELKIDGSGSTNVRCFDLIAENVDLDLSGAGDAQVYASGKITGEISGSADVSYKGGGQTDIHTSGASSVKKVD